MNKKLDGTFEFTNELTNNTKYRNITANVQFNCGEFIGIHIFMGEKCWVENNGPNQPIVNLCPESCKVLYEALSFSIKNQQN